MYQKEYYRIKLEIHRKNGVTSSGLRGTKFVDRNKKKRNKKKISRKDKENG